MPRWGSRPIGPAAARELPELELRELRSLDHLEWLQPRQHLAHRIASLAVPSRQQLGLDPDISRISENGVNDPQPSRDVSEGLSRQAALHVASPQLRGGTFAQRAANARVAYQMRSMFAAPTKLTVCALSRPAAYRAYLCRL